MLFSFLIAVGILAALTSVVPMLHLCSFGCQRLVSRAPGLAQKHSQTQPGLKRTALHEVA